MTRLVLRGNRNTWRRYLDEAADTAIAVAGGRRTGDYASALLVAEVVMHHDRMLIGLPGDDYRRTERRRERLTEAVQALRNQIAVQRNGEGKMS